MRGEPANVAEISHPRKLSPSLPFAETDLWFACGPPPKSRQGWKLYVSLTMVNASEIIRRLFPIAASAGLHFKYIRSIKMLRKLNAGMFGYTQIGKCFVIYLSEVNAGFIEDLKLALAEYRDQCPEVPCARPFGDDLPLYYRYGGYHDRDLELGGKTVADKREDAEAAVPDGVADVIEPYTSPVSEDPRIRSFLLQFPAYMAILQQGKCGVFLALNLASETFQEVVLKVAYHRGQVQPNGDDGCTFIRRELEVYRKIATRRLDGAVPQLIDALDLPRKVILVLERIPGENLLVQMMQGSLTVAHLEQCWKLIERIHAEGLFLGDAKLANFLVTDDGDLRAVDFEAAGEIGEPAGHIRTFIINPDPPDVRIADRAHFLASVLFPYEDGRYSWEDRHVELAALLQSKPDSEVDAWAIDKLRGVLDEIN